MFDVIGIIFLIIILVFIIIGFISGFVSLLLGLAKGLVAIVFAALLCRPIGMALSNSSMGQGLTNKIEQKIVNIDPMFNEIITNETKDEFIEHQLGEKLNAIKLPKTINQYIVNLISGKVEIKTDEGITCGKYIASGISMFIFIIISFIILAILLFIILWLIQKFAKKINLIPLVGKINRIFGIFLGLVVSCFIISIASYILSFIMALPWGLADTIKESLKIGKDEFTIGKFLYEHNILKWLLNLIFKK